MAIKTKEPQNSLKLNNEPLQWVDTFTYLGVVIDKQLSFNQQIKYLKAKASTKQAPLKFMTSTTLGAGYHVLQTYYKVAIRSLVDYASLTLVNLNNIQIQSLEVIQNNAMRTILGTPMWTRICNLQMECNLPPLIARVEARNTAISAKALCSTNNNIFKTQLQRELVRHPDLPIPNNYISKIGLQIQKTGLSNILKNLQPDACHPNYSRPPPWEDINFTINFTSLPCSKNTCAPNFILQAANRAIQQVETANSISYYTDGSVDNNIPAAGAAVFSNNFTASWRVSNNCSSLQAELIAIKEALQYSVDHESKSAIIHTDSMSSLQILQKRDFSNNIGLTTNILALIDQHKRQNRSVTFNWIPSHIGIPGNDHADALAKNTLHSTIIHKCVQPSIPQIKSLTKKHTITAKLANFNHWLNNNSSSANWYSKTTQLKDHLVNKHTPRDLAVILHRLRLGYKCSWEVINPGERDCKHCSSPTNLPLLHYLLECPSTSSLKPHPSISTQANAPNALEEATKVVANICNDVSIHQDTLLSFPPPR